MIYATKIIDDIELRQTCQVSPEQYDAFDQDGKPAGYLRLRFGRFSVNYHDARNDLIFEHIFDGDDDYKGCFEDDDERDMYLTLAVGAIQAARMR